MAANRKHAFVLRICSWAYCAKCGLILLNNPATHKAASAPCPGHEEDR